MHFFKVKTHKLRGPVVSLLVFALLVSGVLALLNQTQARSGDEQAKLLKDALKRAAISCYAVEGRYPSTLEYMKEHYGIVINEDRFIVRYDAFAENIMPGIIVLERGKGMAVEDDDEYEDGYDDFYD